MAARRHHYVSQCYLNGFTPPQAKPKLTVFDRNKNAAFSTSPSNVANERDFHTIEIDGVAPDALENALSFFESDLAVSLQRIIKSQTIADSNDRLVLINFIALLAVKNPRFRQNFQDFEHRVCNAILGTLSSKKEIWESHTRKAKQAGYMPDSDVTYERMLDFVKRGDLKFQSPNTSQLQRELSSLDEVIALLLERKWILYRSAKANGGFITSDQPICLMPTARNKREGIFRGGLGSSNTLLLFPISPGLAMVGSFEAVEEEIEAGDALVAEINGATILNARRQVYAENAKFLYRLFENTSIKEGPTLFANPHFVKRR